MDGSFIEDDSVSMLAAASNVGVAPTSLPATWQTVKRDIRHISDAAKMRSYMLEHDAELAAYSTAILNSWLSIDGFKFYRKHHVLGLTKQSETRYRSISKLCEAVDGIKPDIEELRGLVGALYQASKMRV
jgi:hypothetical protein